MTIVFTECGCGSPPVRLADIANRARPHKPAHILGPVVDVHAHILCPRIDAIVADHPVLRAIAAGQPAAQGDASVRFNIAQLMQLQPRMTDPVLRIADMDAMGVDMQVLSPSPTQYHYWADRELTTKLVNIQNENILALCEAYSTHFLGFGTVSLQFPDLAATQLERLMRHPAIKGVQISSVVNDTALDDDALLPFWEAAERTGAVVFIHPLGTTLGSRLAPSYLSNVIGQPLETTIAIWRLIFAGTLDRHPHLKVLCAHGGGYVPAYSARSDQAWHVRPEAHGCRDVPSSYLSCLWFDSLVYEPQALRRLVHQVGSERVVLGTDFPFDMGAYAPFELVSSNDFTADQQQAILAGNAETLFNLGV